MSQSIATSGAGIVLVNAAPFTQSGSGALSIAPAIANGGFLLTLNGSGSGTATVSGIISGTGGLTVNTTGSSWTLSGANTYTGATTISGGTVKVSADNNLGATSSSLTLGGGTLEQTTGITSARNISLTAGTNSGITVDAGTFTYTGGISFGDTTQTLTLNVLTGATATLSGQVKASGGIGGALSKSGGGTATLSGGSNVNLTSTSVSGGTLAISTASGASLGSTTLNSTGTLSLGTTVASSSLTFSGGSLFLAGTLGTSASPQSFSLANITAASGINFNSQSGFLTFSSLPSSTGSKIDVTGYTASSSQQLRVPTTDNTLLNNLFSISTGSVTTTTIGGFTVLAASAIPEPSTWAAIAALSGLGVAVYRRRRAAGVQVAVTAQV